MRKLSYFAIVIAALFVSLWVYRVASRSGIQRKNENPHMQEVLGTPESPPDAVCRSIAGLPDRMCTPGATRTSDRDEICNGQSTKLFRPSSSYTNQLKRQGLADYGFQDQDFSDYEEDHLIPLELGGDGRNPKNLWPEPHSGPYGSLAKDKVENWLHRQVCLGRMNLGEAQQGIALDWRQYQQVVYGQTLSP